MGDEIGAAVATPTFSLGWIDHRIGGEVNFQLGMLRFASSPPLGMQYSHADAFICMSPVTFWVEFLWWLRIFNVVGLAYEPLLEMRTTPARGRLCPPLF